MAVLFSEDSDVVSSLEVSPGAKSPPMGEETWQAITVRLVSGSYQMAVGDDKGVCLVCRSPEDEIAFLLVELSEMLNHDRETVIFEPAEPSFQLEFHHTPDGGISVYAWIDSGNATSGFYRWDAAGIRLFTNEEKLSAFVNQLKADFNFGDGPLLSECGK